MIRIMNGNKLTRFLPVLLPALLFISCVSMNTEIRIDGAGRIRAAVDYTVSRYVVNFGRTDSRDPFIPLPITRQDFTERSLQVPGSVLESYDYRENEDAVSVRAVMTFRSLSDMGAFFSIPMTQNGTRAVITVIDGTGTAISADTWAMITPLFEGDTVKITVIAPAPVTAHSHGELSRDRRSVTFSRPMLDLLKTTGRLDWEISW